MASVEELIIKLSADNSDLKRKLTDSEKGVQNFGGAVNKLGPMIAGAFSVAVVTNFAKAAFRAYEEQEKANKRLLFALQGNKTAFKELTDQANKLQSQTGIADDSIMQIQMLARQSGKTTEEIKKITEATINLASATGQDLQGVYLQLNQTLTGSAGGLGRIDADFTKLSKTQLENGGAVDLVLQKYAGFAAESATATDKLTASWDEFAETVGKSISGYILPLIEELNTSLQNMLNTISVKEFMKNAGVNSGFFSSNAKDDAREILKIVQQAQDAAGRANAIRQLSGKAGYYSGEYGKEYNAMIAEGIKMLTAAQLDNGKVIQNNTPIIQKSTESIDAWVAAYEKALQLAQYDVPQIGQFAGITMGGATGKGITQKVAPRKGWNTKREAESPLAGAIRLENKLMDEQMAKIDALSNSFGMLADIMGRNTLAYKAFAIAQATMDTYKAATMALATYPPPFGQIMMASTIALGLGNIAKISGAFAMGGIVGGGSYAGDKVLARVNSGEMILNTSQQAQLFAMANGGGGRSMEVYGRIKAGDIYLSNKRGAYLSKRRGS